MVSGIEDHEIVISCDLSVVHYQYPLVQIRASNIHAPKEKAFPHKNYQTCRTGSEAIVLFAWPFFRKCDSSAITIWMKTI
jgi:hypothetical protein